VPWGRSLAALALVLLAPLSARPEDSQPIAADAESGFVRPEPAGGMATGWEPGQASAASGADRLSADDIHQRLQDQLVAGVARPRIDLNIEFEFNSAQLTALGRSDLDEAGETMERFFPDNRFVLAGHTDSKGPEQYNLTLSIERAEAARRYLLDAHQIEPGRIEARGFGESRPLPGQPDERNRRVELELLR
jgi:outer membrane protein OmpA-like peptidoglycan-associated protein